MRQAWFLTLCPLWSFVFFVFQYFQIKRVAKDYWPPETDGKLIMK